MDKKPYITQAEGRTLSFPFGYHQTFSHPFEMNRVMNESLAVKTFIGDADEQRQVGLEVLILLHDYTFATYDQLERLLLAKGIQNTDILEDLLKSYINRRFINCFTLSAYQMDHIPEDAFVIYCLDHAARHVLSHFYHDDISVTWKSTNAIRNAELVSKYLATNEFYLSLLTAKANSLSFFQPIVNFTLRNRDIRMSATFRIMSGATPRDFILEVIRSGDLPVNWRKKVNEQIAPFMTDKFWTRYFRIEPVFLFLAENEVQAEEVSEIYHLRTGSARFRVTTDRELLKGIDQAVFYKYDPEREPRLIPVVSALFRKEDG